ncbi:MAG: response regulator [Bermanella sp.]
MARNDVMERVILIVENSEVYRNILKQMLREIGRFQVYAASTGQEALKLCEKEQYDAILCDFDLGIGKNGLQLLEELRTAQLITVSTVFMMITATVDKNIVLSCLEHRPDVFIAKPFNHNTLNKRLGKAFQLQDKLSRIITAIDEKRYEEALEFCDEALNEQTEFESWCLKAKCEILFELKSFKKVIEVCEAVITLKPQEWAQLMLGKALCAIDQHDEALGVFKALYCENSDNVQAYEEAAHIHLKRGESEAAQQLLQQASDLTGHSVPRLRQLADLCEKNNDIKAATQAYREVVKRASFSIHDRAENNLDLARSLTESAVKCDYVESKILTAEALTALNRANKTFNTRKVKVHSTFIASQAFSCIDEPEKAHEFLETALAGYEALREDEQSIDLKVEVVRSWAATGDITKATELINELNGHEEFNERLASRIDRISEEPVSESGKDEIKVINRKGIKYYENKKFDKAISYFNKALKRYPKHIGIRLNLAQAILGQLTEKGPESNLVQQCIEDLSHLDHLQPEHAQYQRLKVLTNKINEFKSRCVAS